MHSASEYCHDHLGRCVCRHRLLRRADRLHAAVDSVKPRIGLTNPEFRYTSSVNTDIRKLFNRVRKEMAEQQKQAQVVPIKRENRK